MIITCKGNSLYLRPLFSALILVFFSSRLFAQPVISSFSPQSAAAGTTITINGSNFNPVSTSDYVFFGNMRGTVTTASATTITAIVPTGATNLPISVTDIDVQLTGYSSSNFLPVFPGMATPITTIAQASVVNTNSGSNTIFIKTADLDGDGKPDLIASYTFANIGLFLNTSTPGNLTSASFNTEVDLASGNRSTLVAVADMNGDGKPDLVSYNRDIPELDVWQNQSVPGTISFLKVVTLPNTGTTIAVGDIDGDGRPDIIQTDPTQTTLSVIKNNSTGGLLNNTSFGAPVAYPCGNGIEFMAVHDLDGDGKPELITCNRKDNNVSVYQNMATNGVIDNTSLAARVNYPAGKGPFNIAITDIDGDGLADLIITNTDTNTISIFKNLTTPGTINSGSFAAAVNFVSGQTPNLLDVGDLDGDGKPDIAVCNTQSGTVSVFKNISATGAIDQSSLATRSDFTSGLFPYSATIADLDGDGQPEISVANQVTNTISIFETSINHLPPTITAFTPDTAASGQTVTIRGAHFSGTTQVKFGDSAAVSFKETADTLIIAVVGGGTSGKISVTTSLGTGSLDGFVYRHVPILNSISLLTGGKGDTITLHGNYLLYTTAVSFGGTSVSFIKAISDTVVQAVVAAGTSGLVQVTTLFGTTSIGGFVYINPTDLISFNPAAGFAGDTIYIHGTSMATTSAVTFGGTPAAKIFITGDTLVKAVLGTGSSGYVKLTANYGSDSLAGFEYLAIKLLAFLPDSLSTGGILTIRGKHLSGATSVTIGGTPAFSFIVLNDSVIKASIGNGSSGYITVTSPLGKDSLAGFKYFIRYPKLSSFTPMEAGIGTTITIKGVYLVGTNAVNFGGIPAASFTVLSDSVVTAITGIGTSGYVSLFTGIGNDSLPGFIYDTIVTLPHLISFSPATGSTDSVIIIQGKRFNTISQVTFGGTNAKSFTILNDSVIRAVVGAGSSGFVAVKSPTYGSDSLAGFIFIPPTPHIINFTPSEAGGGATITINGHYLTGTWAVGFGGTPAASFTVVSDNMITAVTGSGHSGYVSVFTLNGNDSLAGFVYDTIVTLPHLISYSPATGSTDSVIIIKGQHLSTISQVTFGGTNAKSYTILNDSVIRAVVGVGASGYVAVITQNYGDDSLAGFVFVAPTPLYPKVKSFTPKEAGIGTTITIRGLNLTGTYAVDFGGTPAASFVIVSDSVVTAVTGIGRTGYVSVFTPIGSDSLAGFVYDTIVTLPHLISFSPATGSTDSVIIIKGQHLNTISQVSFGGTDAKSFTILNDSVIRAVVGAGASGYVAVKSQNYGDDSLAGFVFVAPVILPQIISFSPATGSTDSVITIKGSHLATISQVTFGGTNAKSFSIQSDSVIEAVVGGGSSGYVTISTGSFSDSLAGFTFIVPTQLAPVINSFTPDSGQTGTVVLIRGTSFTGASSVSFGNTAAGSFTVESDSLISATVGSGASGNVQVTTAAGTATDSGFHYITAAIDTNYALIFFGGKDTSAQVTLFWVTKNDQSIARYDIQRSADSLSFNTIDSRGSNQQSGRQNYIYNDTHPLTGISYYRLQIVDTNGFITYSKIITVSSYNNSILIYPNPATSYIMVNTPASPNLSLIRILDGMGKTMRLVQLPPNVSQTRIEVYGMLPGTYTVSWNDGFTFIAAQLQMQ
jgi:hypothetical protein